MLKGFNSDLLIEGRRYHVQTEDWGRENPFIVTKVFREGAVVQTLKKAYAEISPQPTAGELQEALQSQHRSVIDRLHDGRRTVPGR